LKIFKHEEYTIAQDSKRDFTIVEKNNNFFKKFIKFDQPSGAYPNPNRFIVELLIMRFFRYVNPGSPAGLAKHSKKYLAA